MPAHDPPVDDDVATPGESARPTPWVADAVLALATTLVLAVVVAVGPEPDDVAGYLLALTCGALVLLRRRAPVPMLVLTVAAVFAYGAVVHGALAADSVPWTSGYPLAGSALPAVTALGSAALLGHIRWAIGAGAALLVVSTTVDVAVAVVVAVVVGGLGAGSSIVSEAPPAGGVVEDLVTNLALVVAAVALGVAVRLAARERHRAGLAGAASEARTEAEESHSAQVRHQAERLRIARDLHDVIGHHLSVVALHTSVAREAVGRDDDAARTALRHVREATSGTLHELRATVGVLRRPDTTGTGVPTDAKALVQPTLRDTLPAITGPVGLSMLVEPARSAGLEVNTWVDVPAGSIDAIVDAAAYRIVQESLANVLQHAAAGHAVVRLVVNDGRLRVAVSDDGRGATHGTPDGAGLAAIRDRAALLGGSLVAQERDGGGFTVVADLPTRMSEAGAS